MPQVYLQLLEPCMAQSWAQVSCWTCGGGGSVTACRSPWLCVVRGVPDAGRSPCPGLPAPTLAGGREAETWRFQERRKGCPGAPRLLPQGSAGRTPAFPISCQARRPLPQLPLPAAGLAAVGCLQGRRGAWAPEDSRALQPLRLARYKEGASTRMNRFLPPSSVSPRPSAAQAPGVPFLSPRSWNKCLRPPPEPCIERLLSTGLWGPSGDTLLRLLEQRVRCGKLATRAGQREGGPAAARPAGLPEEGGGGRRKEGAAGRGRPQTCRQPGRLCGREPLRRRHGNRGAPKHSSQSRGSGARRTHTPISGLARGPPKWERGRTGRSAQGSPPAQRPWGAGGRGAGRGVRTEPRPGRPHGWVRFISRAT